jgi:Outer membrane protein beta-barrel domain
MKRLLLIIAMPFCVFQMAQSQVSIRPQVGVNFPKLTSDISDGHFKGNAGYQFGADVMLGGAFYIQPGINFETANFSLDSPVSAGDIRVSRINIPVYAGFRLISNEDHTLGLRVFGGPNFAINVNENLDQSLSFINKDNFRDSQVSGVIGTGVDLSIFFVDAAYKFGISHFFQNTNSDARINLFLVNAGLRLGF